MADMIYQKRSLRTAGDTDKWRETSAAQQRMRGGATQSRPSAYNDDPAPQSSLPLDGSALDPLNLGNDPKNDTKTLLYVGGAIALGIMVWAFSGKKGGKKRAKVSGHKAKKSKTRKR